MARFWRGNPSHCKCDHIDCGCWKFDDIIEVLSSDDGGVNIKVIHDSENIACIGDIRYIQHSHFLSDLMPMINIQSHKISAFYV